MLLVRRLWDYFNNREEETLDSLSAIHSAEASRARARARDHPLSSEQEELWLQYEPDAEDLEFL